MFKSSQLDNAYQVAFFRVLFTWKPAFLITASKDFCLCVHTPFTGKPYVTENLTPPSATSNKRMYMLHSSVLGTLPDMQYSAALAFCSLKLL